MGDIYGDHSDQASKSPTDAGHSDDFSMSQFVVKGKGEAVMNKIQEERRKQKRKQKQLRWGGAVLVTLGAGGTGFGGVLSYLLASGHKLFDAGTIGSVNYIALIGMCVSVVCLITTLLLTKACK